MVRGIKNWWWGILLQGKFFLVGGGMRKFLVVEGDSPHTGHVFDSQTIVNFICCCLLVFMTFFKKFQFSTALQIEYLTAMYYCLVFLQHVLGYNYLPFCEKWRKYFHVCIYIFQTFSINVLNLIDLTEL